MVVHLIKDHSEKKMYKAKLHNGEVRTIRYWNIRCFSESKTARDHKRSTSAFVGNGQNGFYVSNAVEEMVLEQAGE